MIDQFEKNAKAEMKKKLEHFEQELKTLSTGRANPEMLQSVKPEVYGSPMPLKQVATITIPEPRQLLITPHDPSNVQAIMKAIETSKLGFNPQTDGKVVRINVPQMTEERRKDIVKQGKEMAEKCKVALRTVRANSRDLVKKDKSIPEDLVQKFEKSIQKILDDTVKEVDALFAKKEKEIMTV